jgi:hypothetical protein
MALTPNPSPRWGEGSRIGAIIKSLFLRPQDLMISWESYGPMWDASAAP